MLEQKQFGVNLLFESVVFRLLFSIFFAAFLLLRLISVFIAVLSSLRVIDFSVRKILSVY